MDMPVRRVALLLQGWGGWHTHLIRGVQAFAHTAPHWRLHVDGGLPGTSRIESNPEKWDGIISSSIRGDGVLRKLRRQRHVKIVGLSSAQHPGIDIPVVRVDDTVIANCIGEHLLAGGFRQLAYLGPFGWGRIDHRAAAVRAFAEKRELPFHAFVARPAGKSNLDSAFPMRQAIRWVSGLPKPFGVVVWNMAAAQHVVEACVRAGLDVPGQAAVVSCDDDPVISETSSPTISGMVLPAERIAYRAAELLNTLMAGDAPPAQPVLVAPSKVLRVRGSSDAMSLPNRDVHLAVQFIREHAREPMKVEQVARRIGTSRSRLDEKFLQVLGHTPHEELARVHLGRAQQLLVETGWPIDRIATESGFGTARTMYRAFLERCGQTPAAYRQRYGV